MNMKAALALAAVLFVSQIQAALFTSPHVRELSSRTFDKAIKSSQKLQLIAFTAPWCGYCKKLGPEMDKAAANLKDLVDISFVDCDAESNKPLCGKYDVRGFPTIKIFRKGRNAGVYNGERATKAIIEYATSQMPSFVTPVTDAKQLDTVKKDKPATLLFTSSAKITPLYKALSSEFSGKFDFYAARDARVGPEALSAYGIEKIPSLVVVTDAGIERYSGPIKYAQIKTFLDSVEAKASKHDEL